MDEAADIQAFLERQDRRERMTRFIVERRIEDVTSPDFALTPRTRRLQCWGGDEKGGKPNPFVLVHAVPDNPKERAWSLSDERMWSWLDPNQRRYGPWSGGIFLYPGRKATAGGIMFEDGSRGDTSRLENYVAVECAGIVEVGLAGAAAVIQDNHVGFNLLPIVGTIWRLLRFVPEFYKQIDMTSLFTLIVSVRKAQDSILGGLAQGWRDPWHDPWQDGRGLGLFCREPALRLIYPGIQPASDEDTVARLVREIAVDVEGAWGYGGPGNAPRCYIHGDDKHAGEFDEVAFSNLMR